MELNLLERIAHYFSREWSGDKENAPKMEMSVDDLRYISSMNQERCRHRHDKRIINKDLRFYLESNEENGVVTIPKFMVEKWIDLTKQN